MDIRMEEIDYGSVDYEKTIDLRNEVFRKPWGLDIKDDDLSEDKEMDIYGAYLKDELIGCIFISPYSPDTLRIRNVALYDHYQGQGIGRLMMDFAEGKVLEKGFSKIFLVGRVHVEDFYNKLGYKTIGESFDHKKVPHVNMKKEFKKGL